MTEPIYRIWTNPERTVLLRMWTNGQIEVAMRNDPGDVWGPPVRLYEND